MSSYTAAYGHDDACAPGRLTLKATDDEGAKAELRAFVASGYRNQTWAVVTLQSGYSYQCANAHGRAVSCLMPPQRAINFGIPTP